MKKKVSRVEAIIIMRAAKEFRAKQAELNFARPAVVRPSAAVPVPDVLHKTKVFSRFISIIKNWFR